MGTLIDPSLGTKRDWSTIFEKNWGILRWISQYCSLFPFNIPILNPQCVCVHSMNIKYPTTIIWGSSHFFFSFKKGFSYWKILWIAFLDWLARTFWPSHFLKGSSKGSNMTILDSRNKATGRNVDVELPEWCWVILCGWFKKTWPL